MYGTFIYIYHKFKTNVGKYSIHGAYGYHEHIGKSTYQVPYMTVFSPPFIAAAFFFTPAARRQGGDQEKFKEITRAYEVTYQHVQGQWSPNFSGT